jgi:CARDB
MSLHVTSRLFAAVGLVLVATGSPAESQSHPLPLPESAVPAVDLVAKGVVIGGQFVNVGAVETIHSYKALAYANGKCRFAFQYNVKNQGAAKTPAPFRNVVLWDAAILAQDAGQMLNAGVSHDYFFEAWLQPGAHVLTLRTDADHTVAESDETNNQRTTRVVIMGICSDALTTRSAAPAKGPGSHSVPLALKPATGKSR